VTRIALCDLIENAEKLAGRQVEVSGIVSRGFEDFTFRDDACKRKESTSKNLDVWLTFGGKRGSGVKYCCGQTIDSSVDREAPLVVNGVPTVLIENDALRRFEEITNVRKGYGKAKARLIGRFFPTKGNQEFAGYGHFGTYSLFVIERVEDVEKLDAAHP